MRMRGALYALTIAAAAALAPAAQASDHADPIGLERLEAGLAGLFVFPAGDRLIIVLGARRALVTQEPFDLKPYWFSVHLDLDSPVSFDDPRRNAIYGGRVERPEAIGEDVRLAVRLNDDATVAERRINNLADPSEVRLWTGVRDDPFIFPSFFATNIIAVAWSLPRSALPSDSSPILIWGTTTTGDGEQIDHVGRANRTQLPRFDFLNPLPPSEHVAAIESRREKGSRVQRLISRYLAPVTGLYELVFKLRPYDVAPDVLIYSAQRPPGFPNGRQLTDDVVGLTCAQGDCFFLDLAFARTDAVRGNLEGPACPAVETPDGFRRKTNDKRFLDVFPYLAEPWTHETCLQRPAGKSVSPIWLAAALAVIVLVILGVTYWLGWRCGRRKALK